MSTHIRTPPPGATCPNCSALITGVWCSACGQEWTPLNPTWGDLVHEGLHEFLHLDGKIFRTLRLLLTRPGVLSRDFLNGHRQRSIGPLRLYLTASLVFFLLAAIIPNVDFKPERAATPQPAPSSAAAPSAAGQIATSVSQSRSAEIAAEVTHDFPKLVFLLVPLFGLWLKILLPVRRHYPAFLYFSLHVHAALFFFMALTLPLQAFASDRVLTLAEATVLIGMLVYLVVAVKVTFGVPTRTAFWRASAAMLLQLACFVAGLSALIGLVISTQG